jgi:cbb3-type cytochrome oxidase maturation protein
MNVIYLLIPLSLVLVGVAIWAFMWAIKSGQFEDLEGPAHRILLDDDNPGGQCNQTSLPADSAKKGEDRSETSDLR